MGQAISKLTIKGYKSIRSLENFELRNLNILIGPNGAGKSNFLSFFEFLQEFAQGEDAFNSFIEKKGKADKFLYLGPKVTQQIKVEFGFSSEAMFSLRLNVTSDNRFAKDSPSLPVKGVTQEGIIDRKGVMEIIDFIRTKIHKEWLVYHYHDTSDFAAVKRSCSKRDYDYLRPDASNLGAYLLRLKEKKNKEYTYLCEVIQLASPFFDEFIFDTNEDRGEVEWWWRQKGSDYPFHPSQISDGTLRFICLATALLQPNPPSMILLDEPELGLHPYALNLLAGLIEKAAACTQVIVSTQSAILIDSFEPEDIIVVERQRGESVFKRLNKNDLNIWLEDYSLGELWQKNVFGGRPSYE